MHCLPMTPFWALCNPVSPNEDDKEGKVFENGEDRLEIKRRSWEARMTQNGKKETQVGP